MLRKDSRSKSIESYVPTTAHLATEDSEYSDTESNGQGGFVYGTQTRQKSTRFPKRYLGRLQVWILWIFFYAGVFLDYFSRYLFFS